MMYIGGLTLGVPDPFDMTDDELVQVRDFLSSKKHLVKFLWNQSYDFWLAFKKEEVWIGYAWPDTVGYADAAGMNYLYMQPKEGRVSWVVRDGAREEHAELLPRARLRGLLGEQEGGGVPRGLVLLRSHEHDGGSLGGLAGRREARWGSTTPRSWTRHGRSPSRTSRGATSTSSTGARCWRPDASEHRAPVAEPWRPRRPLRRPSTGVGASAA